MNKKGGFITGAVLALIGIVIIASFLPVIDVMVGEAGDTLDASNSLSSTSSTKTLLGLIGLFMAVGLIIAIFMHFQTPTQGRIQ